MPSKGKVLVVGQGYVGLPLAMRAVEVGYDVVGVDLDVDRAAALAVGNSYVEDVTSEQLKKALDSNRYRPSSDYQHSAEFDFAVITVPTPLREGLPDLSYIESAARSIAPITKPGAVVILESTTYPGTTEEVLIPILEQGSGLVSGTNLYVGYSPERIDPGNKKWGFVETPKVVSGACGEALDKVRSFYDDLVNITVPVASPKEAELAKLLENTFRHVNIALVNELAVFAHQLGVDVWEAIDAASTKPFGFMRFTPGPGVGGHCLPVDPSYLSWEVKRKLGQNFRFVELANDVNEHMPDYVVQRLMRILNDRAVALRGAKVLVVGLAYKANTGDTREAPALRLIELLHEYGAEVYAADPHVENHRWPSGVRSAKLAADELNQFDCAVVVTFHDEFDQNVFEASELPVLDTRRVVTGPCIEYL